ncbi:MAG TPA: leucyl/phenylalanyl-tRNA--protein transferase [Aestuariivirgaceae bacterium]|nr:leucyl/phenylalanyl-tRNA--protein transferase [Aestuariivirgaceae bacterium]
MTTVTPQILLKAYASGVFPMAESAEDSALYWVEPEHRGVLPLDGFHLSRTLRKAVRQRRFEIRIDTAFGRVISMCAEKTASRPTTWINSRIRSLYNQLHKMGCAHSVECWQGGVLCGGLYGVRIGAAFFGESMFTRRREASKVALVHLVARLRAGGFRLLDAQFINDHIKQFGAIEMPRARYQALLDAALAGEADFHGFAADDDPAAVLALVKPDERRSR